MEITCNVSRAKQERKREERGKLDTRDACSHIVIGHLLHRLWHTSIKPARMCDGQSVNKSMTILIYRTITFWGTKFITSFDYDGEWNN